MLISAERYRAITQDIKFNPDGELWDETKAGQWSDIVSDSEIVQ